jgi:hypothetical protein
MKKKKKFGYGQILWCGVLFQRPQYNRGEFYLVQEKGAWPKI